MDLAARMRAKGLGSQRPGRRCVGLSVLSVLPALPASPVSPVWLLSLVATVLAGLSCGGEVAESESLERFAGRARAMLAEADSLVLRAESFDEERVLEQLAYQAQDRTFFTRFDRVAPFSVEGGRSGPDARPERPDTRAGVIALRPLRSSARHEGALQIIEFEHGDRLENRDPIRLEKAAIAEFELRIKVERSKTLELGWSSEPPAAPRPRKRKTRESDTRVYIDTLPDGEFHTYRINASNALQIGKEPEDIRRIFLSPTRTSNDNIELDYLRVVEKGERYARNDWGRSYEEIDSQMRAVLYSATPRALRYRVSLPEGALFFSAGMAALDSGDPIDFSLRIHGPSGVRTVLQERVEASGRWHDRKVDLSAWSGKQVEVELRATSERGNVAFWSNPILYAPPTRRFNVLFIVQDTLRADRLSAYGHSRKTSPEFDAFVGKGVLFEHAISQATKTRPSVAAMMTGLYPTAVGVWNFHEMLDERYVTLAEILRARGFATGAFMGNPNAGPYAGLHQGFEFLVHRFPGRARLPGEPYLIQRASEIIGPDVDRWIAEQRDRNFFLYLHLVDPHGAYDAPPPYDAWFAQVDSKALPELERDFKLDPPGVARPTGEGRRRMYDGEILYNDRHIADLLQRLEASGILRDTLVIFASDHGEFLGLRAPDQWGHHPPGFAQVTRVPLAMVLPGVLPAGRRVSQAVQLIDVLPTVLELAGIDGEGLVLQGRSLVPLVRGAESTSLRERVLVSDEVIGRQRSDTRPWGSIYFDGMHFLNSRKFFTREELADPDLDPTLRVEAFRFQDDPAETSNLAADTAEPPGPGWEAWQLETSQFLQQLVEKNGLIWSAMTGESDDEDDEIRLDPQVREQLKGLGYIQ